MTAVSTFIPLPSTTRCLLVKWWFPARHYDSPYLVYHEKVKSSHVFIRDCSMVSVYPLVLFGGGQVNVELQKGEFVIFLERVPCLQLLHKISTTALRKGALCTAGV
uniref:DEAD-box helicase OB fold domain-containing protein n=1 Tax=Hucho hucho TaxID=62062 RepID=A0A4W5RD56_9TELE